MNGGGERYFFVGWGNSPSAEIGGRQSSKKKRKILHRDAEGRCKGGGKKVTRNGEELAGSLYLAPKKKKANVRDSIKGSGGGGEVCWEGESQYIEQSRKNLWRSTIKLERKEKPRQLVSLLFTMALLICKTTNWISAKGPRVHPKCGEPRTLKRGYKNEGRDVGEAVGRFAPSGL